MLEHVPDFSVLRRRLAIPFGDGITFHVTIRFVDLVDVLQGGGSIPGVGAAAPAEERLAALRAASEMFARRGVVEPTNLFEGDDPIWPHLPLQVQQIIGDAVAEFSLVGAGRDVVKANDFREGDYR